LEKQLEELKQHSNAGKSISSVKCRQERKRARIHETDLPTSHCLAAGPHSPGIGSSLRVDLNLAFAIHALHGDRCLVPMKRCRADSPRSDHIVFGHGDSDTRRAGYQGDIGEFPVARILRATGRRPVMRWAAKLVNRCYVDDTQGASGSGRGGTDISESIAVNLREMMVCERQS